MHLLFCAHLIIFYYIFRIVDLIDITIGVLTLCNLLLQQFSFFLYKSCIHTNLIKISLAGVCVCGGGGGGGGGGQLIYIVSPNRYVNIQSVF